MKCVCCGIENYRKDVKDMVAIFIWYYSVPLTAAVDPLCIWCYNFYHPMIKRLIARRMLKSL